MNTLYIKIFVISIIIIVIIVTIVLLTKKKNNTNSPPPAPSPCVPNCTNKTCGLNGCGGTCGSCTACYACEDSNCIPKTPCEGGIIQCGSDPCNPGFSCGTCSVDQTCTNGQCTISCPSYAHPSGNLCVCNDNKVLNNDCCYSGGEPTNERGQPLIVPSQCCNGYTTLDYAPFWICN